MPAEPAPGQAAMEAWEVHWATAPRRGRGKPGYDEHADGVAGWEAAAAAVAAPLNAEIASLREQLAEQRRLLGNHKRAAALSHTELAALVDQLRSERDTARDDALQLATRLRLAEGERDEARAERSRYVELTIRRGEGLTAIRGRLPLGRHAAPDECAEMDRIAREALEGGG